MMGTSTNAPPPNQPQTFSPNSLCGGSGSVPFSVIDPCGLLQHIQQWVEQNRCKGDSCLATLDRQGDQGGGGGGLEALLLRCINSTPAPQPIPHYSPDPSSGSQVSTSVEIYRQPSIL